MADERLMVVSARVRHEGRLDRRVRGTDPELPALRALGREPDWIGGGEPTLRADLPALLQELRPDGVITDGLALTQAKVVRGLVGHGLRKVRIALHSSDREAHDWLVGAPGSARRAQHAIAAQQSQTGQACCGNGPPGGDFHVDLFSKFYFCLAASLHWAAGP